MKKDMKKKGGGMSNVMLSQKGGEEDMIDNTNSEKKHCFLAAWGLG